MVYTRETLCSKALILIGANGIAKMDEGSTEAEVCANIYELITYNLLCYPWSFALKQAKLARLQDTAEVGFKYLYALPTDFLMSISLCEEKTSGKSALTFKYMDGNLFTDAEKPVLTYVHKVKEDAFPDYFASALVYKLAADFAMPLTGNPETAAYWDKKAEIECRRARNLDSRQKTSVSFVNSYLTDIRH